MWPEHEKLDAAVIVLLGLLALFGVAFVIAVAVQGAREKVTPADRAWNCTYLDPAVICVKKDGGAR